MRILKNSGLAAAALLGTLSMLPASASAQQLNPEACTATVEPTAVDSGQKAVQLTVTVSEPVGPVTGLTAAEDSAIKLASAGDLPRTAMAANEQTPSPIKMGEAENSWIIFVNTADATAGIHDLTFETAEGQCTGQLTVGPAS